MWDWSFGYLLALIPYFLNWSNTLDSCYTQWAKWKIKSSLPLKFKTGVSFLIQELFCVWQLELEGTQCKLSISHLAKMCCFLSEWDNWLPFNIFSVILISNESAAELFVSQADEHSLVTTPIITNHYAETVTSFLCVLFWRPFYRFV